MKKSLSFIILVFIAFNANAQSLTIFDLDGNDVSNTTIEVIGHPSDETITQQFDVFNSNDSSLFVDAKRIEDSCIVGSGEFFCWTLCLGSEECGTSYERGMPFALTVDSNSFGTLPLVVDFEPSYDSDADGAEGNACYTYILFDKNNESDSVYVKMCYTIDYAIGIDEVKDDVSISNVYPNPANNFIYIDLLGEIENAHFEIYSLVGEKVGGERMSIANGKMKMDVSDLPTGIYLLQEVQTQLTRKFIISR